MIRKAIFFLLKAIILTGTISAFAVAYLVFYYTSDLPDYNELAKYHPPLATRIYTIDGKLIEQYARENRVFVDIKSVPKHLIHAFVAAEDKNFYNHLGIDVIGVARATITNIHNMLTNKRLQGASTITQQVVKNLLLTNERSIARKIKEAALSYMVSKTFTKDQILELYLNQTFFGKGAYGVASASQVYFNKSPEALSLEEAAFIAALPKAPSNFDPVRNYAKSKDRRDYVINRMLEDGYITVEEARTALKSEIILKSRYKEDLVSAGYAAEVVRQIVSDMVGEDQFYTEGYTVITTLDSKIQKELTESFVEGIRAFDQKKGYRKPVAKISIDNWKDNLNKIQDQLNMREYKLAVILSLTDNQASIGLKDGSKGTIPISEAKWARSGVKSLKSFLNAGDVIAVENLGNHYGLRQIPEVNGGMIASDPRTGCVRAHVGGYDFNANKFDRITQAIRQPGSTIKSFVYLAALENGIKPNAIFEDGPISISQGKGMPPWQPKNYKGDFLGAITFRKALEKSRNLVTVRVAQKIGIQKVADTFVRFGICPQPKLYYSMVLGAVDTTVAKMVNAYSIIANGGLQVMPNYIEMIQDKNGKIIYRRNDSICKNCENYDEKSTSLPEVEVMGKNRVLDERVAYQLTSILKGAVQRGTSARLAKHNLPLASKTGTTNLSYDAWTISYTPTVIVGGYVGYDQPQELGKRESGATVALPIIDSFLTKIEGRISHKDFTMPEGIEIRLIDKDSGAYYTGVGAIGEAFATGVINGGSADHNNEGRESIQTEDVIISDENITKEQMDNLIENTGEIY
ncbi:MAG: penicillin-binding protein 1A [Rickettsiaceae bacterium]|nr:penicillin-binding protein 1A [Rickettsiaceae bacterium]